MNDNDIIKAKEYFTYGITHDIFSAPVISHAKTALLAFEKINRQKAEISVKDKWLSKAKKRLDEVRVEAIKEFAERLDDKSESLWWLDDGEPSKSHVERFVLMSDVDNLVKEIKEMVGERKCQV